MEYWKYKAIDRLRDYRAVKASVANLSDEIAMLEYESRRIKSATADGSPVRGGGNGREDRLLDNMVDREEKRFLLEQAKKKVVGVERGLAVLNDTERHILTAMYIEPTKDPVEELMDEFELADRTTVYRRINKALNRFTVAMFGCTES